MHTDKYKPYKESHKHTHTRIQTQTDRHSDGKQEERLKNRKIPRNINFLWTFEKKRKIKTLNI